MFKCKVNTCSISGCNYTWTRCHHREGRQRNSGYCGSDVPLLTCVLGLICSQDAKWNENGVLWEINILIIMTYIMTNYEWSKGTLLKHQDTFWQPGIWCSGFWWALEIRTFYCNMDTLWGWSFHNFMYHMWTHSSCTSKYTVPLECSKCVF